MKIEAKKNDLYYRQDDDTERYIFIMGYDGDQYDYIRVVIGDESQTAVARAKRTNISLFGYDRMEDARHTFIRMII